MHSTSPHPYEEGRLPMSEDELSTVERNRRLMRRVAAPLMGVMGGCGLVGGIWAISTDAVLIGTGLTFSSLIMLGFAWFYLVDTRRPIERPEKFFVTGVVTAKRKYGSAFTSVYYQLTLNNGKYQCYLSKQDFDRLNPGDVVQCERLEETSVNADRVIVMGRRS